MHVPLCEPALYRRDQPRGGLHLCLVRLGWAKQPLRARFKGRLQGGRTAHGCKSTRKSNTMLFVSTPMILRVFSTPTTWMLSTATSRAMAMGSFWPAERAFGSPATTSRGRQAQEFTSQASPESPSRETISRVKQASGSVARHSCGPAATPRAETSPFTPVSAHAHRSRLCAGLPVD